MHNVRPWTSKCEDFGVDICSWYSYACGDTCKKYFRTFLGKWEIRFRVRVGIRPGRIIVYLGVRKRGKKVQYMYVKYSENTYKKLSVCVCMLERERERCKVAAENIP